MEFDFERWYTFCEEHKKLVKNEGSWDTMSEADTCDYMTRKKRCGKVAYHEFYPGETWA